MTVEALMGIGPLRWGALKVGPIGVVRSTLLATTARGSTINGTQQTRRPIAKSTSPGLRKPISEDRGIRAPSLVTTQHQRGVPVSEVHDHRYTSSGGRCCGGCAGKSTHGKCRYPGCQQSPHRVIDSSCQRESEIEAGEPDNSLNGRQGVGK